MAQPSSPPAAFLASPQLYKRIAGLQDGASTEDGFSSDDEACLPPSAAQPSSPPAAFFASPQLHKRIVGLQDDASTEDEFSSDEELCLPPSALTFRRRSVRFNLAAVTFDVVHAYSEIYGRHPREFVFDHDGAMLDVADLDAEAEDTPLDVDERQMEQGDSHMRVVS